MPNRVEITRHAQQQIADRLLDPAVVTQVALQPEQIVYSQNTLPIAQSRITIEGKTYLLRIAFRDEEDVRRVVTAYPTSKIDKYWQGDQP